MTFINSFYFPPDQIHLPNGGANMVKYGDATDIRTIVDVVTANLCPHSSQERAYSKCYAIRLNHLNR